MACCVTESWIGNESFKVIHHMEEMLMMLLAMVIFFMLLAGVGDDLPRR
jgi:hypothetical protein